MPAGEAFASGDDQHRLADADEQPGQPSAVPIELRQSARQRLAVLVIDPIGCIGLDPLAEWDREGR